MSLELPANPSKYLRSLRTAKMPLATDRSQGYIIEQEPDGIGNVVACATVFLTGAECRFTCSMCDLWQYTLDTLTPHGSLPQQLEHTLRDISLVHPSVKVVKLYNASSFFDINNVPEADLPALANLVRSFERVVVENHPLLFRKASVLEATKFFAGQIHGQLEVAMGLESIRPSAMQLLNKQMTLDDFQFAADALHQLKVATRTFVLLQPPGDVPSDSVDWAVRACRFAWDCGVQHCSIIPTRTSPGWLQQIHDKKQWQPPTAQQLERSLKTALAELREQSPITEMRSTQKSVTERTDVCEPCHNDGLTTHPIAMRMVTADLWDWDKLSGCCEECRDTRRRRMEAMNIMQRADIDEIADSDIFRVRCSCELG